MGRLFGKAGASLGQALGQHQRRDAAGGSAATRVAPSPASAYPSGDPAAQEGTLWEQLSDIAWCPVSGLAWLLPDCVHLNLPVDEEMRSCDGDAAVI